MYTPKPWEKGRHSSKARHTKKNYFATMGRKGGNTTKRRHSKGKNTYYRTIGKKGGAKTLRDKR